MNNDPVFPAKLFLFNEDGKYNKDEIITITDESHLNSPEIVKTMKDHIQSGKELRMTDPMDSCLFHAMNGKIIFPAPSPTI